MRFLLLFLLAGTALAGPATEFLRAQQRTLRQLARSGDARERARCAVEIAAFLDFEGFAKEVIGDLVLPARERETLREKLDDVFVAEVRQSLAETELSFTGERQEDGQTVVEAVGIDAVKIDFVLDPPRDRNGWRVVDVYTDPARLAKNYKYEVKRLYANGGMPAVVDNLQEKVDALGEDDDDAAADEGSGEGGSGEGGSGDGQPDQD